MQASAGRENSVKKLHRLDDIYYLNSDLNVSKTRQSRTAYRPYVEVSYCSGVALIEKRVAVGTTTYAAPMESDVLAKELSYAICLVTE